MTHIKISCHCREAERRTLDNTGLTAEETVAAADRLIRDQLGDRLRQAATCL